MQTLKAEFERLKKFNLRSIGVDTFWSMFSQGVVVLSNLALVYFLANLLSPNDFGQYKLITSWIAIALGLAYSGYVYVLPQALATGANFSFYKIIRNTFLKSIPASAILLFMSVYYFYFNNTNLSFGFLFATFVIPFLATASLCNYYFIGKKDFKRLALTQNSVDVMQALTIIICAYLTTNFVLIIFFFFLITLVGNYILIKYTINFSKDHTNSNGNEDLELKSANKLNIAAIYANVVGQIDKLLTFHFMDGVSLATYSIVTAISDQARSPVKAIGVVLMPRMAERNTGYKSMFKIFLFLFIPCGVLCITLIFLNPLIFKYIFPKYESFIYLANLAAFSILFAPISLLQYYLQSKKDLDTINTYTYMVPTAQILLFTVAGILKSLVLMIIFRNFIMLSGIIYLTYRILSRRV